jgi:hypothetical protein
MKRWLREVSMWLLLMVITSYLTSISGTCLYNNLFVASILLASEIFPDAPSLALPWKAPAQESGSTSRRLLAD